MIKAKMLLTVILSVLLFQNTKADDLKSELQKYINEIITEVREAETPDEKREILNNLFEDLQQAFAIAKNSPYVPESDLKGIESLEQKINERSNELNGNDGFEKIPDNRLNQFASFTLQDIEQADTVLTISLTTLLLIIILAILIF